MASMGTAHSMIIDNFVVACRIKVSKQGSNNGKFDFTLIHQWKGEHCVQYGCIAMSLPYSLFQ
jgi:hypothetical protein